MSRRTPPPGARGQGLLELLVAAACSSLVSAIVLGLLVDTTSSARERVAWLESVALARAAVASLDDVVRRAGAGLEGASQIQQSGLVRAALKVDDRGLSAVVAVDEAHEVDPVGPGTYRAAGARALRPGDLVLGLGLRPAPVGTVRTRPRTRRGASVLSVRWAAPERALLVAQGEPRALLPVVIRQFALRRDASGMTLRRRDDEGPWQPVVDGISGLSVQVRQLTSPDAAVAHDCAGGRQVVTIAAEARASERAAAGSARAVRRRCA